MPYRGQNIPGLLLDPSDPINVGLVGFWPINEGQGQWVNDISINRNRAPFVSGAGKWGESIIFPNSVNAYLSAGNPTTLQLTGAMTVSFWIKANGQAGTEAAAVGKCGAGGARGFQVSFNNSGGGSFFIASNAVNLFSVAFTGHQSDRWVHYAAVYIPSTSITVYRNGVQIAQNTTSIPAQQYNGVNNFAIGSRIDAGALILGLIQGVRVHSRALNLNEIQKLAAHRYCGLYYPNTGKYFVSTGGPTYTLTVTAATFIFTGKVVALQTGRRLAITPASFAFSGKTVGLKAGRKLPVTAGAFVFSGKTVGLTYTPGGGGPTYSVAWLPGSFAFSGKTVGLKAGRKLAVSPYAFGLNGKTVGLVHGSSITYTKHSRLLIDSVGGKVLELGDNVVNSWGTATRPATPKDKTIGFNTQTVALDIYDGAAWKSVTLT